MAGIKRKAGYSRVMVRSRPAARRYVKVKRRGGGRTGVFLNVGVSEMKFHDSGRASAALATAWTTGELDPTTDNCLNGIATGTGESEHLGRRYRIREVTLKCQVNLPAVTTAAAPPGS